MSERTTLILVLALILATFGFPAALATEQEETVRLVVPASRAPRALTGEKPEARWVTIEVPLVGGMETTLEKARRRFGLDISVERFYELAVDPEDDEFYTEQWHLENDVDDADIDAKRAWGFADGSGVVVAVIDSGIEGSHPDLAGQVISGIDYVDGGEPNPEGTGGAEAHGTYIAGLIAAADNDIGVVGVAPGAKILNMRACSGGLCSNLDLVNAIYDSVDKGADIINLSLGSYELEEVGDPALATAIEYARDRNVLVVAAGGNDGVNLDHLQTDEGEPIVIIPAGLPQGNILAVGASDRLDRRPQFSNYGSVLDLFAPGTDMATTGLDSTYVNAGEGTSYAAPVAAGVAALLLSHDPGIGYQELIARVVAFTDRPGSLNAPPGVRANAGKALTNRFIDTSNTVFHNTIKWLAEQNITEGCNPPENHRYCPADNVTRGQMAVFFARTFGLASTSKDFFTDDDGAFYENAANRMAAAGITVGCGDDRYCGDRDISRGEMAAMLSRVVGLPESGTDHFGDDDGTTFEGAINRIAEANITQGCNPPANDRFCPEDDVNRGQMAAFLERSSKLAG